MNSNTQPSQGLHKFVGYRVGSTYCLSPSSLVSAVLEVPAQLFHYPGSKPWVMGGAKLGRDSIPYINLPHFLNVPASESRTGNSSPSPALIVRDSVKDRSIGLKVDEIVGFIDAGEIQDVDDPEFEIPIGFGSFLCGTVSAKGKTWALIDLNNLATDERINKIDLS